MVVLKKESIAYSVPRRKDDFVNKAIISFCEENERFANVDSAFVRCLPEHLGGWAWHSGGTDPNEAEHVTVDFYRKKQFETTRHIYRLNLSIQALMKRIFDNQCINDALNDLNYDSKRCSLLDLDKNTISQGYLTLQELSALIKNAPSAQNQQGTVRQDLAKQMSKIYYETFIARSPESCPAIRTYETLQKEMKFLDTLVELQETCRIMYIARKNSESPSPVDRSFSRLNTEMRLVEDGTNSREGYEIAQYFYHTLDDDQKAKKWKIGGLFSIERKEEKTRFQEGRFAGVPGSRRLLWYGSRLSTLGGILKQGLRINGSVPGKGIGNFSDMCSKAAIDCYSNSSNGYAILLLCEVCTSGRWSPVTRPSYKEAKEWIAGKGHTIVVLGTLEPCWKDARDLGPEFEGVGIPDVTQPHSSRNLPNSQNRFNEYIVYNENQVKLRYLLTVRMT